MTDTMRWVLTEALRENGEHYGNSTREVQRITTSALAELERTNGDYGVYLSTMYRALQLACDQLDTLKRQNDDRHASK